MARIAPVDLRTWPFTVLTGASGLVIGGSGQNATANPRIYTTGGVLITMAFNGTLPFFWEVKNNDATDLLRVMWCDPRIASATTLAIIQAANSASPTMDPYMTLKPGEAYSQPWREQVQQIDGTVGALMNLEQNGLCIYGVDSSNVASSILASGNIVTWSA